MGPFHAQFAVVLASPQELRDSILEGGGRCQGSGYGQDNFCRLIYDFTKVAILATNFADYRDVASGIDFCFLYSWILLERSEAYAKRRCKISEFDNSQGG